MKEFFNRISERERAKQLLSRLNKLSPCVMWIEGISGVGKTQFLKHIILNTNITIFKVLDDSFYKCDKINMNNDFEYISNLIFTLQTEFPSEIEKYINKYFSNIEHISVLDACTVVLPQIKYLKSVNDLLQVKYKGSIHTKSFIADKIVNIQLIDFFSDLILYFLLSIYEYKEVVFSIDDVQWLDKLSLSVMVNIIKKVKSKDLPINISFFCTARSKVDLSKEEVNNFMSIYKSLYDVVNDIYTIKISNFTLQTTTELVKSKGRLRLEKRIYQIYEATKGNPQELEQTLRFDDDEIDILLSEFLNKENSYINKKNLFSKEYIMSLFREEFCYAIILNLLSIITCGVSKSLLYSLSIEIYTKYKSDILVYNHFCLILQQLEEKEVISVSTDIVEITHDSIKFIIKELLIDTGEYAEYGNIIADVLIRFNLKEFKKNNSNMYIALNLLLEIDPYKGLRVFLNYFKNNLSLVDTEIYILGSKCYCSNISLTTSKSTDNIIITKVLPRLVNTYNLVEAQRLCKFLYKKIHILTLNQKIQFLINFIKVQTDLSILNDQNGLEISAPELFELLEQQNISNKNIKLQKYVLGMSVYEHVLNYNKIEELSYKAELLVKNNQHLDNRLLSIYYRNKGLHQPHRCLKTDYVKAINYAKNIKSIQYQTLMLGTCLNNLGLTYFYSGKIKSAIKTFTNAKVILDKIGYETVRIDNNIAMCYLIDNDINTAFDLLSQIIVNNIDGIFIKSCIDTNYALILSMLGKFQEAKKLLDIYLDEYEDSNKKLRTPDTLLYCAAMINRGYTDYLTKDYFSAAKYYKMSSFHKYRFDDDLLKLKREKMLTICLQKAGCIPDNSETSMDIKNSKSSYYLKPYSTILFAYYVV